MGIEDRLRRIESYEKAKAAEQSRQQVVGVGRAGDANRQLQRLLAETAPLLEKRDHPKCLEIIRIEVKAGVFGPRLKKIQTGRVIRMFKRRNNWGSGMSPQHGISDAGELLEYMPVEHPDLMSRAFGGFDIQTARTLVTPELKATVQRFGCSAAGFKFQTVRAYGDPQKSGTNQGDPNVFFLSSSNRLMHGNENWAVDAEDWIAARLSEG